MASDIELHIEELVLHGFPLGDRYRIAEGMQRELESLFEVQGIPPSLMQGGEIARLDAGMLEVAPDFRAGAIGTQVSRAVYNALNYPKAAEPSFTGGDE